MKRVGWVAHFASRDKLVIHQATLWDRTKPPTVLQETEEAVRIQIQVELIGASFVREAERCLTRLPSVPHETLQWLAGISSAQPSNRPFVRKAEADTITRYYIIGKRYLGFCLRAYYLGREQAYEQWALSFTDEQWSILCDLQYAVEALVSRTEPPAVAREARRSYDPWTFTPDYESLPSERGLSDRTPKEEALDRTVFQFFLTSIRQYIGGNLYLNPLLCFCAALGIRTDPLGYYEPHLYTTKLAAILWLVRLFFLESEFIDEPYELEAVSAEAVQRFREAHTQWLVTGTHTPASTIIAWMAYGRGWRQQMAGQGSVRWSEDHQVLFHNGEAIPIRTFQQTACGLIDEADRVLDQVLDGAWDQLRTKVALIRIADHFVRVGAGQSFATDARNIWLGPGSRTILDLLGPSLWDDVRGRWKPKRVYSWLQKLRTFREVLLVLVHIWGGQPGRGPEVTTLRHCDSWQLVRNIFILDGQVMLVTDRDKTKALRDQGRKVARFLPERIGQLLITYIVWLLPTERLLRTQCNLRPAIGEQLEYLWCDGSSGVWDTERLSSLLVRMLQPGLGLRIGVARYRGIAIEFGRRIRGLTIQQTEFQTEADDEADDFDVDPLTGEPVETGGGSWNIVWDLQATHSTKVARQHYAVHVGFLGRLQPEMIATFRTISSLWHQFLSGTDEKASQEDRTKGRGIKRQADRTYEESPRKAADSKVTDEELLSGLRTLLGPEANWKSSEQAECCRTILQLQGEQTAICILPTGAGKSLLFFVPAILGSGGINIVIIPFVALIEDLVKRARTMGVDCIQFKPGLRTGREGPPRAARLIIVSADIAVTPEFAVFTDGLQAVGLLGRIFLDECHTILTDVGYRVRLGELKGVRRFGKPTIFLTATLPPVFLSWFRTEVLAEDAQLIRARTSKANCRYRVEVVPVGSGAEAGWKAKEKAVLARTIAIAQELGARMQGRQKGVIYCRSREETRTVAEALGCLYHHSGMSEDERLAARTSWIEGQEGQRWITATIGLGTGVDIEGIIAVVHMGLPYGLIDFVQQVGRGGRWEGEVVDSVILYDGQADRRREYSANGFLESTNILQMQSYVSTKGCRRAILGAFLDGTDSESCTTVAGAVPCDHCEQQQQQPAAPTASWEGGVWRSYGRTEGQRVRLLYRWLLEVEDSCSTVCGVLRAIRARSLGMLEAPCEQNGSRKEWCRLVRRVCKKEVLGKYEERRRSIRFEELSCCFRCKLPLDWCEERRTGANRTACTAEDRVLPVVLILAEEQWVRGLVKRKFEVDSSDRTRFFFWLGQKQRFHGTYGTNILLLWEEILWTAYEKGEVYTRYEGK